MKSPLLSALALASTLAFSGCETTGPQAASPALDTRVGDAKQALQELKAGNERFVQAAMHQRDLQLHVEQTSTAQYPFASIVSCADSRVPPELVFDQGIGDLFVTRVAGNVVDADILGSLEYGAKKLHAKLLLVLGHTQCGAVKGAIDKVQMGNLTGVLDKIKPAVNATPAVDGSKSSKNVAFVDAVSRANVRLVMRQIRARSPILSKMIDSGEVVIIGGMYDLATGRVTLFEE